MIAASALCYIGAGNFGRCAQLEPMHRLALLPAAAAPVTAMIAAIVAVITMPLAILATAAPAEANGTATVIMERTQGPYRVLVGIIPARPVIPQTHLTIQVFAATPDAGVASDQDDQLPLRDTDVELLVSASGPPGAPSFGPRRVFNEQTRRYFEVDVPFAVTGAWDVALSVTSERGMEVFALPLEVGEPGARIQWVWVAAVMAAILVVGIWTILTLRQRADGD